MTGHATGILEAEHRHIEVALAVLSAMADRVEAGGPEDVPGEDVARLVGFLEGFADTIHHEKEEGILFVAMEAVGFPRDAGPLGVMHAEHAEARAKVAAMRAVAASGLTGAGAARRFTDAARRYAALLREHIQKEDQVLYPMARERLDDAALVELARRMDAHDAERTEARRAHLRTLEQLRERYLARARAADV